MHTSTTILRALLLGGLACLPGCAPMPEKPASVAPDDVIDPVISLESAATEPAFRIEPPTFHRPVTAAMVVTPADVWIKVLIAGGYHIYGQVGDLGPFQSLVVDLTLPEGVVVEGDWIYPKPLQMKGHAVYRESVVLRRRLRASTEPRLPIEATVQCQACNEEACFPPTRIRLSEARIESP